MIYAPNQAQSAVADGIIQLFRDLTPPILVRAVRHLRGGQSDAIRFTGNYTSWDQARACSLGYDAESLFALVRASAAKVRDGGAAFERDGIAFDRLEHPFALLACLLHVATASGNRLNVLDYGGSLGSTFFQCRGFLSSVPEIRWSVVEQPHFVECGIHDFTTPGLYFYPTVVECFRGNAINVALLSSVLQYLPDPHAALAEIEAQHIPWLIIDRTPLVEIPHDRLCVQSVPASLYGFPVSYPAWLFGRRKLLDRLADNWSVILDVEVTEGPFLGPGFQVPYRLLLCKAHDPGHLSGSSQEPGSGDL